MSTTLPPDLPLHRVAEALGARVAARFRRLEAQGTRLTSGRGDVGRGQIASSGRVPLGVVLLACGPECSALLVAEHVGAALAMGNRVVVAFVEPPSGPLAVLVATLEAALPVSMFHAVRGHGESWSITADDLLVVAVLTAAHLTIEDRRHTHATRASNGATDALLHAYSADVVAVPSVR